MPLIDLTLFGTVDKVGVAIQRLRDYEPDEGYYVAYSGGKDSTAILELAKMAGVKYDAHYNLPTVDPPEVVRFIRLQEEIAIERPEHTMWELILRHHIPPLRNIRYCCEELKEHGGTGRTVVTGIRWAESNRRKRTREMIEGCNIYDRITLNPIIDWTEREVWQFIRSRHLPYCSLYDEGFKRLGCILCPMGRRRQRLQQADRWPKYYAQYVRTFDRMLEDRAVRAGKASFTGRDDEAGQDVMDWWLSDNPRVPEAQMALEMGEV